MDDLSMYKNLDPSDNFSKYLTTPEIINGLEPTTFCHDLIGIVRNVDITQRSQRVMNFEFVISDHKTAYAMTAWGSNAVRLENVVLNNDVIAIDGVYVKFAELKNEYTLGRDKAFTLQNNSIVVNLTKLHFGESSNQNALTHENIPIYEDIQQCVNEVNSNSTIIGLIAFVKTTFVQGRPELTLRCGALTDKKLKITTLVKIYDNPNVKLEVGQKLKAYGRIVEFKDKIAFEINCLKDIEVLADEKCSVDALRLITKTPQKIKASSQRPSSNPAAKKLRMD